MNPQNHHCCVLQLNGTGILIEGPSQSGKTSLLMGLLERAKAGAIEAHFICDDQALLEVDKGQLIAKAPAAIEGQLEIAGYGIIKQTALASTHIDYVINIIPDENIERMPDIKATSLCNVSIPLIEVPQRHETQSVRIIFASLLLI